MSSREIADLTGKLHTHVLRDIRVMLTELGETETKFGSSYIDSTGRSLPCFNLPKRETLILVSGYSVVLRSRIIDRWQELEAQTAPALPNFNNPAEAARAWADQFEARQVAEERLKVTQDTLTKISHHQRSLTDVVRFFTDVNSMCIKKDLLNAGYLYRAKGHYRVYARYRTDYFIEKADQRTGKFEVFVGPEGNELLAKLHAEGRLTFRKGFAA